jgi:2-amino-4-hydroxy-6-hydroxymethyldihydropteridine diphosphokinase
MSRPHWRPAYVGVGSNLDDPRAQVRAGIDAIRRIPKTRLCLKSGNYRSAPLSGDSQPDYINAVVGILTLLPAEALLEELRSIEDARGRDRDAGRWRPRTLDLDLLALSDQVVDTEALTLPHPGIAERNFVLLPWAEIAPHFRVPELGLVKDLAGRLESGLRIERLA